MITHKSKLRKINNEWFWIAIPKQYDYIFSKQHQQKGVVSKELGNSLYEVYLKDGSYHIHEYDLEIIKEEFYLKQIKDLLIKMDSKEMFLTEYQNMLMKIKEIFLLT